MKTKSLLFAAALLAVVAFTSCKPSDAKLQQQVTAGLTAVSSAISSEVKKGVVTLNGVVDSEAAKAAAEKVAAAVKGIKSVANNIQVKLPEPVINPDDVLKQAISTAVTAGGDAFKSVVVAVKDSEVTLTGEIKKANLQKLMQLVNDAKPKKVINSLTVK